MNKEKARPEAPLPKNKIQKNKIVLSDVRIDKIPKPLSQKSLGTPKSLSQNFVSLKSQTTQAQRTYAPALARRQKSSTGWVKYAGAAVFAALVLAALGPWKIEFNHVTAATVVYVNGYPTIDGNYVDCNGNIDNDMSHHVTDPSDTDPSHHIGQNCPVGSLVALASAATTGSGSSAAAPTTATPTVTPATSAPVVTISSPAAPVAPSDVTIWWPMDGATIMGTQPFKAVVSGLSLNQYQMYWQVDGGKLNIMGNSNVGGAHKESKVDVSSWTWKGSGPYQVTFVAQDLAGKVIAANSANVYIPASIASGTGVSSSGSPTAINTSGNPLAGASFYRDPNNNAQQWINNNSWQSSNIVLMSKIAGQPTAVWLGSWNSNVANDVASVISNAKSQGQIPLFVVYNIPNRDCGGYSAGGAQTASDYQNWINQIKSGLGSNKVAVVIEPDGTALTSCLSSAELTTRYALIKYAVQALKGDSNAAVYIDAGHPNWISAGDMASRLQQSGISSADGFALNVSNFTATADNISYGQAVSSQVGNKHFIIDTSRNGLGPDPSGAWCNPSGRALGSKPTTSNTGSSLVDALVWGKDPGGSDGNCNGGPSAGTFWPDYALGLASRTSW